MKRVVIGHHQAKTGGTTISGHLKHSVGDDAILIVGPHNSYRSFFANKPLPEEMPREQIERARLVFGHGADENAIHLLNGFEDNADILFVTRDPVRHFKSRLAHRAARKHLLGLETETEKDLLSRMEESPIVSTLVKLFPSFVDPQASSLEEKVTSIVKACRFAMSTEKFNDQLPYFFDWLGAPPRAEARRVRGTGQTKLNVDEEEILQKNRVEKRINDIVAQATWSDESESLNGLGFEPSLRDDGLKRLRACRPSDAELLRSGYQRLVEGFRVSHTFAAAMYHLESGEASIGDPELLSELISNKIAELELSTSSPNELTSLAAHLLTEKKFESCIEKATLALEAGGRSPRTLKTLGTAHFKVSDYAKAREYLQEAVELSPKEPNFWFYLAQSERRLGNLEAAKTAFAAANDLTNGRFSQQLNKVENAIAAKKKH